MRRGATTRDQQELPLDAVRSDARPFTGWAPNSKLALASSGVVARVPLRAESARAATSSTASASSPPSRASTRSTTRSGGTSRRTSDAPTCSVRPGITGCITPGGENFGPHRGRCILGVRKAASVGHPRRQIAARHGDRGAALRPRRQRDGDARRVGRHPRRALRARVRARSERRPRRSASSSMAEKKLTSSGGGGQGGAGRGAPKGQGERGGQGRPRRARGRRRQAARRRPRRRRAAAGRRPISTRASSPCCRSAPRPRRTSVLCTCETSGGVSRAEIVRCADCLLSICRAAAPRRP